MAYFMGEKNQTVSMAIFHLPKIRARDRRVLGGLT